MSSTVNILGRLRLATKQVREIQTTLVKDGQRETIDLLENVSKELDGILYNLVDILSDETRQTGEINVTSNDEEISKWLEQTFSSKQTRSISTTTTSRFESIKAIIQASSFVNALQRQLRQHTKDHLASMFHLPVDINDLNQWTFPILNYKDPMIFSVLLIFDAHDLISRYQIDIDVLRNFSRMLTEGYTKFRPAYHNDYHGADVLQTTHCFLIKSHLINSFSQIEIAALLFAAAVHDYEHPGLNNNYLVKTKSDLALIYNDLSVLENHHSSSVFILLRDKRWNICSNMGTDEYRTFRSLVISLVLATDMANHASLIERMSTYFFLNEENSPTNTTDSKALLQMVLHAADISNATKPWTIYIQSAEKIMEEFFMQGDLEKIHYEDKKPTFDRDTTNIPQLQIGFITHIVNPTFDVLSKIFQTHRYSKLTQTFPWQADLQLNLETWRQIASNSNVDRLVLQKKPLKLNIDYLQIYVQKAKNSLKKRSQHELLLNNKTTSS